MIVRRLARPMLSTVFVTGGYDAFKNPAPRAAVVEPAVQKIAERARPLAEKAARAGEPGVTQASQTVTDAVAGAADKVDEAAGAAADTVDAATEPAVTATTKADEAATTVAEVAQDVRTTVRDVAAGKPLPFETETYVKVNGAVQMGAGLLLGLGKFPRLSSAALAASLLPTTVVGHRFWELEGDERKAQKVHFTKNMSLLGGLLLAAADTEGRPGVAWRARHARKEAKLAAKLTAANAAVATKATRANARAARRLARANAKVAARAGRRGIDTAQARIADRLHN